MERQQYLILSIEKIKILLFIVLFFIVLSLKSNNDTLNNNCESLIIKSKDFNEFNLHYNLNRQCLGSFKENYIPTICPIYKIKIKKFSSLFGNRLHPIDNTVKFHYGIDISSDYGSPVHATASGIVLKSNVSDDGYGNQIEIKHKYGFITKYAHMNPIIVKKGDLLKKGDIIGFVGSTGKSTNSHLHYEVQKNGRKIDPFPFCKLDSSETYYSSENKLFIKTMESEMSGKPITNEVIDNRRRRSPKTNEKDKINFTKPTNITAVIDNENKEIEDGDNVRIRIIEEMPYNSLLIEKNSYVYATVKYELNRVRLFINEIIVDEEPKKIELEIYENDGLPGLYVNGIFPTEPIETNQEEEKQSKRSRKKEEPNKIILYDNHQIIIK